MLFIREKGDLGQKTERSEAVVYAQGHHPKPRPRFLRTDNENDSIAGLESAGVDPAALQSVLPSSGRRPLRERKENGSLQPSNRPEKLESTELQAIAAAVLSSGLAQADPAEGPSARNS
jgi:hypothetical protein